jgi:His/Glu/Gln/Arg/opine family amino acid ABC transporter permease subunit
MRLLKKRKTRSTVIQIAFAVAIMLIVGGAIVEADYRMTQLGMISGFSFLSKSTGFQIGFSLIPFDPFDSYMRMIGVGILNSLFLGAIIIVFANIAGLIIAVFRISSNGVLNAIGTLYLEVFRNIPLILQALCWYAALTNMPPPKMAYSFLDSVFVSARGIFVPSFNIGGQWLAAVSAVLIVAILGCIWVSTSRRFKRMERRGALLGTIAGIAVLACAAIVFFARIPDEPFISVPHLQGLNFRGGINVPPELGALALAAGIYGSAYIAEIIRAGFLSVGRGQVEAAKALGLTPWQVFSQVHLPLAFRAVLPTLINQYVWLFKATTVGIAVGFADFFSVISVSINQSGQTLELIGILMAGFLIINNTLAFVLNRVNKAIALKGNQLRT